MKSQQTIMVQMIPIDKIQVLNPRARNRKKHLKITENIEHLGLKRPITVCRRKGQEDQYDLVCGQGRLGSFAMLGQKEIPAIVVNVSKEDQLLMSLAENQARRKYDAMELIREIANLKGRGYSNAVIAKKTDLGESYIENILRLYQNGETRLINAVESGVMSISTAITIASTSDKDLQRILQDAYEQKKLNGNQLQAVRKVAEKRNLFGKNCRAQRSRTRGAPKSADGLVNAYREEVARQQLLIKKANICERRFLCIVSALKACFADDNFVNLLRAEGLTTLPKILAGRIHGDRT